MPRQAKAMSARQVETLSKPGMHADGNGLYLQVKETGAKSWIWRYVHNGKRREMGLGGYPAVSLAEARRLGMTQRSALVTGSDPIEAKRAVEPPKVTPTFWEAADAYIKTHEMGWRNAKHRAQWVMTLREYAKPLRDKRVDTIEVRDVLEVLKPLWLEKPETASRLRGRIETVLDAAKAQKHRSGENPAAWRGNLRHLLPARSKLSRGHHAAMPFIDLSAFIERLRGQDGLAPLVLEFTILTAARSGESLGMRWSEVEFNEKVWTIPASRMKAGRVHRVPLSGRAVAILEKAATLRADDAADTFIFPGRGKGKPLSNMTMEMLLRRMMVDFTVHGFRSTFRDWAGEISPFPRDVAEAALAHVVGDETERAYRRSDALEKRRTMMEAWATWCEPHPIGAVVPMQRSGTGR